MKRYIRKLIIYWWRLPRTICENLSLDCQKILLQTAELGVTEHIEGDECKFAVWTGRSPMIENKVILKVNIC